MDHRERAKKALDRFYEKRIREEQRQLLPRRKNESPEKDLVEKPCVNWMRAQGWNVQIFESKATRDGRGNWRNSHMRAGNFDCQGTLPDGVAAYVEFKAPKKRSTVRQKQYEFALEKIGVNAFVVVVDSLISLQAQYNMWRANRAVSLDAARTQLLADLPKPKADADLDLE